MWYFVYLWVAAFQIVMTGSWVLFLIVFVLTFVDFTLEDIKELSTENEKPSDKTHLVNEVYSE